jgi:D-3-phosphoglycerate dehydrogenase
VGKNVARIAKGFGMEVCAFDPFIPADKIEKDNVKVVDSVEELYSSCQYISLHIPANEKTKKSIDYRLMSMMPKGATLVNTARKEVIDEESLLKIFAEREDFHYISDISPDCQVELLDKYADRYFATPKKMGAQTSEANVNAGLAAANQIVNFFKEGDITYKVN